LETILKISAERRRLNASGEIGTERFDEHFFDAWIVGGQLSQPREHRAAQRNVFFGGGEMQQRVDEPIAVADSRDIDMERDVEKRVTQLQRFFFARGA
jgi:hypothetical protein